MANAGGLAQEPGAEKIVQLSTASDLDALLDRVGNSRIVMLGEASHGTHEFYTWRTAITKRLITEKGFSFVAVEGDWPDCYELNRYVKCYHDTCKSAPEALKAFTRWPTWMWANWEVTALLGWMKDHNTSLGANKRVGFYGLDVYSLWESMETLVGYLQKEDPEAAEAAKQALACFQPYKREGQNYAHANFNFPGRCHNSVIKLLTAMRSRAKHYNSDPEAALNTEQNAHVAVNAEKYYRSMIKMNNESWNVRDTHMAETLHRLLKHHGDSAKAIVWEHNTHIGDARATDMAGDGMVNTGQLAREQYGIDEVVLVGFATYTGTVIAGRAWGAPMQEMEVPPARAGSIEASLHNEDSSNRMIIFNRDDPRDRFNKEVPHRAIGVVYHPERERYGNYVPSVLSSRYDALLYFDTTRALHPMFIHPQGGAVPETYPFGV